MDVCTGLPFSLFSMFFKTFVRTEIVQTVLLDCISIALVLVKSTLLFVYMVDYDFGDLGTPTHRDHLCRDSSILSVLAAYILANHIYNAGNMLLLSRDGTVPVQAMLLLMPWILLYTASTVLLALVLLGQGTRAHRRSCSGSASSGDKQVGRQQWTEVDLRNGRAILQEASDQSCCICLEPMVAGDTVTTMPCGHEFHHTCLQLWWRMHGRCPFRCGLPLAISSPWSLGHATV